MFKEDHVKKRILMIIVLTLSSLLLISGGAMACGAKGASKASTEAKMTGAVMPAKTEGQTTAKAQGETVMLKVSNMTCGSCVNHVTKSLAAVEGVNDVKVNLEKGTAEVVYDAGKTKPEMLTAAVIKAGYPAEVTTAVATSGKKAGCDPAACGGMKAGKAGCDPAACGAKTADASSKDKK